jgi:hypothetical protein
MNCERCKQEIPGPSIHRVTVTIGCNPEIGPNDAKINFCCWECAAIWFNAEAGEILMPDLNVDYWREHIAS